MYLIQPNNLWAGPHVTSSGYGHEDSNDEGTLESLDARALKLADDLDELDKTRAACSSRSIWLTFHSSLMS